MSLTTGNNAIDALVYSSWNTQANTPITLTYSFLTRAPSTASADDADGFKAMSATQQAAVRDALLKWSAVANITFVEVAANTGKLLFGTNEQTNSSAYAYLPEPGIRSVSMYLNNTATYNTVFTAGSYGPTVLIHEIGHMLGLKHPGDYDSAGSSLSGPFLPAATDNGDYTQMSYEDPSSYAINRTFASTAMLYDIQAIQYLYGANMSYHTGSDTYVLTSNIAPQCIWDAGGTDTLDFSSCTGATIINLNAGTFSETARGLNNISIAYNVGIESAIAGSGGSTIYANALGNTLTGGAGKDLIYEGAGSDRIAGGAGLDSVVFSRTYGNYVVVRDGGTLTVIGDGVDTLTDVETLVFSDQTFIVSNIASLTYQSGTANNDTIAAPAASSRIDGDDGRDTVIFNNTAAQYRIGTGLGGFTVTSTATGTAHVMIDVERLQFTDVSVALDIDGNAGKLYRLYGAAFDREPDAIGLGFWLKQIDAGQSLASAAQFFAISDEFQQRYGTLDDAGFLVQLYANVLDRAYDQAGYNFWLAALNTGVSRGQILSDFSESAEFQVKLIGSMQDGVEYVPYA
jgi:serralysin